MQSVYLANLRQAASRIQTLLSAFMLLGLACGPSSLSGADTQSLTWIGDYHAGLDEAEQRRLQVLLWFFDPAAGQANEGFERTLADPDIRGRLNASFILVKLPLAARAVCSHEDIVLLDHPAFAEMHHASGLAIVDMTGGESELHRQVVSIYPLAGRPITKQHLATLLDLPRGTLTQRTLIFAVRTHPELPASAGGQLSHVLRRETENHSRHQADITLQGHHNRSTRFHAINAQLPGGMAAREVCAESWPGQNLLDAAVECVHSWRQSAGHWNAVSSAHPLYAYDMKRGRNGVWYATGIFASAQ